MPPKIRVAIVGGGIAGCTLANGLLPHKHIQFDVFESRATFMERGASVGLAANAVNALNALGMDAERALDAAGAMKMTSTQYLAAVGEHKGEKLFELSAGVISVMRSKWLEELLRPLPAQSLHTSKRLVAITRRAGCYMLYFADGSTHEADAVIGCDGIRSRVKEFVLGPGKEATFGGYWDACARITPVRAAKLFGTEIFNSYEPVEVALIGQGASMLFVPNTNGEVYNIIVAAAAGPDFKTSGFKFTLTRSFLEDVFAKWEPGLAAAVIDIMLAPDGPGIGFAQWESPVSHRYYKDGVCLLGDSAHATIPWLGQGACMAMEDSAVLATLLGQVESPVDLPAAFEAYERTRMGRPEHIMSQSREAAQVLTGQKGLDPNVLAPMEVARWWQTVWAFDISAHIQGALGLFKRHRAESREKRQLTTCLEPAGTLTMAHATKNLALCM